MAQIGGKGRIFQRVISMMPPHRTYIETHLGSGAVLRKKRPAQRSVGIDIDALVVKRWCDTPFPGLELIHGCAVDFLRRFVFAGDELVYCDPPYWPDARRRTRCYRHDYTRDQHRQLIDVIRALPCRVMLSGYRNGLYDELLAAWRRHDLINQTQTGPVQESVWTNFEPSHHLHDYSYVGDDFRERERIRRVRRTQMERLRRAPPVERAAMLSDIADAFPDDLIAIAERIR
jgi:hypothetical protein